ncbi:MAG: hypothetical protein PHS45_04515 [Bacilli bacterium]|nr:hypothetical protein [Bacilli bacterium]MDD4644247.1 hypothetical protein [Bacilli bacterium]
MKKVLFSFMLIVLMLSTGCEKIGKVGDYKEGTYFAYDEDSNYTVTMYVDDTGHIKSVLFDAAYLSGCATRGVIDDTCTLTTKRGLGDEYGMARVSDVGEWYEQVDNFSKKVIDEQGIDWLVLKYKDADGKITSEKPADKEEKDKVYTDTVSGVTIVVDNLEKLMNNVLTQAKK